MENTGELFIVGTPIGNMGDLSPRAAETLEKADFIAAEDTRVTGKLLSAIGVKKPMISYFEHNKAERGRLILQKLESGQKVALVTDAGMPAISDPGEDLVSLCVEHGIRVTAVPGPTAALSALAMSGLPTQRFCFEGFLTVSKNGRRERLESLKDEKRTMIFYEAPHKLIATLRDMYAAFGDRRITLCREMTKIHEENIYTTLEKAAGLYSEEEPPRGEFVLVIEGAPEKAGEEDEEDRFIKAEKRAGELINAGASVSEAVRTVCREFSVKRNALYSRLIKRE